MLDALFNEPSRGAIPEAAAAHADAAGAPELWALLAFGTLKLLVLSPLSLAMPTPTGVFLPTLSAAPPSARSRA